MKNRSDNSDWSSLRDKIMGLGNQSVRKTFYPELQKNLNELRRFRTLMDKVSDGIILINLRGLRILDINSSACKMMGCNREVAATKGLEELFVSPGLKKLVNFIKNADDELFEFGFVTVLNPTPRKRIHAEFRVTIEDFSDEKYAVIIIRDITSHTLAEKELLKSKSSLSSTLESTNDLIWSIDKRFKILSMNDAFKNVYRFLENQELEIGQNVLDKAPLSQKKIWMERYERALAGETFITEDKIEVGGKPIYFEFTFNPIKIRGKVTGLVVFGRDVTTQTLSKLALQQSETRFREMIENAPIGAVVLRDKKLIYINDTFLEMFGYSGRSVSNLTNFARFVTKEDRQKLFEKFDLVSSGKETSARQEMKAKNRKGEIFDIQVNFSNVSLIDGPGVVAFVLNITDQKEIQKSLKIAKEQAEKSERLKTEFLAQMSHEIRTPLNNILSFLSLIREDVIEKVEPELSEGFGIIDKAGKRLIRTIDLILNMAEISTNTYDVSFKRINLAEDILNDLYREFKIQADEKGLTFNLNKNGAQALLTGDEYTIKSIFTNLIDNAIKYTLKGKVEINLKHEDGRLVAEVVDTGIGISEENLEKVFEPFAQEHSGYTRPFEGNGLGLAIVRKYCDINNAELCLESKKGVGSKFTVKFSQTEET